MCELLVSGRVNLCLFMLHNKPMLFPNVFFLLCLPGDYMGITRICSINLLVCFWNFYQKRTFRMEKKQEFQKKIIKFPYPQKKQEVWDGSWASCDYVYIIYIVDTKQMVRFFVALKKTGISFWGWYFPTKRFFESEKSEWLDLSPKWMVFFVAHPWKELYNMHTHTLYMYM